jgi:hypothetical protein
MPPQLASTWFQARRLPPKRGDCLRSSSGDWRRAAVRESRFSFRPKLRKRPPFAAEEEAVPGAVATGQAASLGQTGDPAQPLSPPVCEYRGVDAGIERPRISCAANPRRSAGRRELDSVRDGIAWPRALQKVGTDQTAANAALNPIFSPGVRPLADDVAGRRFEAPVGVCARRGHRRHYAGGDNDNGPARPHVSEIPRGGPLSSGIRKRESNRRLRPLLLNGAEGVEPRRIPAARCKRLPATAFRIEEVRSCAN